MYFFFQLLNSKHLNPSLLFKSLLPLPLLFLNLGILRLFLLKLFSLFFELILLLPDLIYFCLPSGIIGRFSTFVLGLLIGNSVLPILSFLWIINDLLGFIEPSLLVIKNFDVVLAREAIYDSLPLLIDRVHLQLLLVAFSQPYSVCTLSLCKVVKRILEWVRWIQEAVRMYWFLVHHLYSNQK